MDGRAHALRFNTLLSEVGIDPADVRLLRHQTQLPNGSAPIDMWRADPAVLDEWQSFQFASQRASLKANWWACFVGTPDGRTLFIGLYEVGEPAPAGNSYTMIMGSSISEDDDRYPLKLSDRLSRYIGRLYIEWGAGKLAWKQRADLQDKAITELHLDVAEKPFPGFLNLTAPLSTISAAPPSWIQQLQAGRGIYVLACPVNGQLYVGSATGSDGFWGRWTSYSANGHGGNIALKDRGRSDWRVSILQVAGSADTEGDILAMESLWIRKLQSRVFGLNRNG